MSYSNSGYGRSSRDYGDRSGGSSRYSSSRSYGGGGDRGYSRGGRGGGGGRGYRPRPPKNEFGISYGQIGANLKAPNWARLDLQPFQKEFYKPSPAVMAMTEAQITEWRVQQQVTCQGPDVPRPIHTFEDSQFPEYILQEVARAGFTKPTPVQAQGWPMALSGRDVIGIAKTGSGKTLAFLLPAIVHINAQPLLRPGDGPIVLVIAPTRELAMQIDKEANKFGYTSRIKHTCVYGGVPKRDQQQQLREGIEIIICTPGRLLDFLEHGTTNLRRVTYLVIDEADRLLDMGFEPQLKSIMSQVRPDRQILMWSATWPKEVRSLAEDLIRPDTLQVSVGSLEVAANHDVLQNIEVIEESQKTSFLFRLLHENLKGSRSGGKVLVFLATKRACDSLCRMLRQDGWNSLAIHGDKPQYERDSVLAQFKSGECNVMLATDVASRGIHVDDINIVINYDFPGNIEDYVHRIGRTGRCGKKGTAYSFFTRSDAKRAQPLVRVLTEAHQVIPPRLHQMAGQNTAQRSHTKYRFGGNSRGGYNSSRSDMRTPRVNGYHGRDSQSRSHSVIQQPPMVRQNMAARPQVQLQQQQQQYAQPSYAMAPSVPQHGPPSGFPNMMQPPPPPPPPPPPGHPQQPASYGAPQQFQYQ